MNTSLLFQIQNILIIAISYYGVSQWRNRKKHMRIQLTGISLDLLLVLQIEVMRGAINTSLKPMQNSWLMNIHIAMAVTCVLLYPFIIYSGRMLYKGKGPFPRYKKLHRRTAITALTLRTLVLITSFLIKA